MRQSTIIYHALALSLLILLYCPHPVTAGDIPPEIPVKDTVTLVDLGAKTCIPCKLMAPILDELKKEYTDRAAIIFIDVWKKPEILKKFTIKTIPTQIFYDKNGKETFRHIGFMDKKSIVTKLEELLAER